MWRRQIGRKTEGASRSRTPKLLPVLVDDLESASRILRHGHTAAGEDSVRSALGDLDSEGELVSDAHRVRLLAVESEDDDLG